MLQNSLQRGSALLLFALLAACGGGLEEAAPQNAAEQAEAAHHQVREGDLPVCPAPLYTRQDISTVQGTGTLSPLEGQQVTVRGIVTGDFQAANQLNGFFIQQAIPDRNKATSDGIFVFAPTRATRPTESLARSRVRWPKFLAMKPLQNSCIATTWS